MWRQAGPYIIVGVAAVLFLVGRYVNRDPVRMIGREAPRFILPVLGEEDKEVDSAHHQGQVCVWVFWQAHGDVVAGAMEFWQSMHKKYGDKGLFVLGISMESSPETAAAYLKQRGITFPQADGMAQLAAGGTSAVRDYQAGVPGVPTAFVVDRGLFIRHHHVGWMSGSAKTCREWVERLLAEPDPTTKPTTQPATKGAEPRKGHMPTQ